MPKKHIFWWTSRPMNEGRDCNLINIKKHSKQEATVFRKTKARVTRNVRLDSCSSGLNNSKGGNISYFKPFDAA